MLENSCEYCKLICRYHYINNKIHFFPKAKINKYNLNIDLVMIVISKRLFFTKSYIDNTVVVCFRICILSQRKVTFSVKLYNSNSSNDN